MDFNGQYKGKVLLALSGGVDSSVCVRLLRESGYEVHAVVMEFSDEHSKAVAAADAVAQSLNVPLHVVECKELFRNEVISKFAASYLSGETPNPCIVCNPLVKFKLLEEKADELGIDKIATGHYARVSQKDGRYFIEKAASLQRDQSYMLYRLTQSQLSKLILPLGEYEKSEVRRLAAEDKLISADAPDSQEICFISDNDYRGYIEKNYGYGPKGRFISPDGEKLGENRGILHYTVGQRKHLGISLGYPVFVSHIDAVSGDVTLARSGEALSSEITLRDCVYQPFERLDAPINAFVKVRSQAKPVSARVEPLPENGAKVIFDEPQRAPAPGQSCVIYDGDILLGGGFINK